jgi:hypothetical protein
VLEIEDGKLTGRVTGVIVDAEEKAVPSNPSARTGHPDQPPS